ncbi:hypothetical protein Tco_1315633 [Tanacetum coccineum]
MGVRDHYVCTGCTYSGEEDFRKFAKSRAHWWGSAFASKPFDLIVAVLPRKYLYPSSRRERAIKSMPHMSKISQQLGWNDRLRVFFIDSLWVQISWVDPDVRKVSQARAACGTLHNITRSGFISLPTLLQYDGQLVVAPKMHYRDKDGEAEFLEFYSVGRLHSWKIGCLVLFHRPFSLSSGLLGDISLEWIICGQSRIIARLKERVGLLREARNPLSPNGVRGAGGLAQKSTSQKSAGKCNTPTSNGDVFAFPIGLEIDRSASSESHARWELELEAEVGSSCLRAFWTISLSSATSDDKQVGRERSGMSVIMPPSDVSKRGESVTSFTRVGVRILDMSSMYGGGGRCTASSMTADRMRRGNCRGQE